jgi:hypothetical protein
MGTVRQQAMELLVRNDPRRAADGLLGILIDALHADAAGLFDVRGDRIVLVVSRGIDQRDIDQAEATWLDTRLSLLAGQTASRTSFALVPLCQDLQLVGALYLSSRPGLKLDHQAVEVLRPMFTTAVGSVDDRSPIENYLERTPTMDIEREQLVVQLNRNEWNIARVARLRGVSRVTVYAQMRKLGIPRERVLKTGRVRPRGDQA